MDYLQHKVLINNGLLYTLPIKISGGGQRVEISSCLTRPATNSYDNSYTLRILDLELV